LPWVPVCLGVGIGAYFALMVEPGAAIWAGLALAALILAWAVAAAGVLARPLTLAVLLVLAGFLLAGTRTRAIETPVLGFRYFGPVEGRIVAIDRATSDRVRITLDRVVLDDMRPDRVPVRV